MSSVQPDFGSRNSMKPEKRFVCPVCQGRFASEYVMRKHISVHSGEKRFSCHICQKRFTEKGSVNKHLRTHTGEKPYVCNVCEKAFAQVSHLKTHSRLHTGERPYSCPFCQRAFIRGSELKIHLRVHTQEKPFVCDLCQKGFQHKRGLDYHYLRHSGEKPYPCDKCPKRFPTNYNLKLHIRNRHSGRNRLTGRKRRVSENGIVRYRAICPAPQKMTVDNASSFRTLQLGNVSSAPQVAKQEIKPRRKISRVPKVDCKPLIQPKQNTSRFRNILPAVQCSTPPPVTYVLLLMTPQLSEQQVTAPSASVIVH